MVEIPLQSKVAIIGIGVAVILALITLAQRMGDWRSKTVAWILGLIASALLVVWAYVVGLWIFNTDLKEFVTLQGILKGTLGILLAAALVWSLRLQRHVISDPRKEAFSRPEENLGAPPPLMGDLPTQQAPRAKEQYQRILGTTSNPPQPELTEEECHAEWSETTSSPSLLRFFVWNATPNSMPCSVRVAGVKRWSDIQDTFIEDSQPFGLYNFVVFKGLVSPEQKQTSGLVEAKAGRFFVLATERGRTYSGSALGRWRLELAITLGQRERLQNLEFEWTPAGLAIAASPAERRREDISDESNSQNSSSGPQPEFTFRAEEQGNGIVVFIAQFFDTTSEHIAKVAVLNIQGVTAGKLHTVPGFHKDGGKFLGRLDLTPATDGRDLHYGQERGWWLIAGLSDAPRIEHRWGKDMEHLETLVHPLGEFVATLEIQAGGRSAKYNVQYRLGTGNTKLIRTWRLEAEERRDSLGPILESEGVGNVQLGLWGFKTLYVLGVKNSQVAVDSIARNVTAKVEYSHADNLDVFTVDPCGWFLGMPPLGMHTAPDIGSGEMFKLILAIKMDQGETRVTAFSHVSCDAGRTLKYGLWTATVTVSGHNCKSISVVTEFGIEKDGTLYGLRQV